MSYSFAKIIFIATSCSAAINLLPAHAVVAQNAENLQIRHQSKHYNADQIISRIKQLEIDLSEKAQTLSLKQAITLAFNNSPRPLQAYRTYQAAAWISISTKRQWLPTIKGNLSAGSSGSINDLRQRPESDSWKKTLNLREASNYAPQLNLNWSIFNPSRTSTLNSQILATQSSSVAVRRSIRDLTLNVQEEYYRLQELRELEDTYQEIYEMCKSQYTRLKHSAFASATNSTDKFQAIETRALEALTLRVASQQRVIAASAALAAVIGLPEDSFILPAERLVPFGQWMLSLEDSLEKALKSNDKIIIADLNAKTISEKASATRLQYAPEISLEAKTSYNNEKFRIGNSGSPNIRTARGIKTDYSVGATLKWNLFDSGVLEASATSLDKQASALKLQAKSERLDTGRQVKSAYGEYTSQLILLPQTAMQLLTAKQALRQATNAPATPSSYQTEFIQSINQYQAAQVARLTTVASHNTSIAKLHNATATWPEWVIPLMEKSLDFASDISLTANDQ